MGSAPPGVSLLVPAEGRQTVRPEWGRGPERGTARETIEYLAPLVRAWLPDAALYLIMTGQGGWDGRADRWDVDYCSAGKETRLNLRIERGTLTLAQEHAAVGGSAGCEPALGWRLDSPEAAQIARAHGGQGVLDRAPFLRLGGGEWTVMLAHESYGGQLNVHVDANSGKVLWAGPPLAVRPRPAASPTPVADLSQHRVVAALPAGDGPGQVGIKPNGHPPSGPQALALGPDGTIYVLDTWNNRVVLLDRAGATRGEVPIKAVFATGLRILADGRMLILDTEGVSRLSPSGGVELRLPVAKDIVGAVSGLSAGTEIGLEIENRSLLALTRDGTPLAADAPADGDDRRDGLPADGTPLTYTVRYSSNDPSTRSATIEASGPAGVVQRLAVQTAHGVALAQVLGVDAGGNTYILVDMLLPGPAVSVERSVRRYRPDGTLAREAGVPKAGRLFRPRQDVVLGPDGEVYALLVLADRALVLRLGFAAELHL